MKNWFLIRIGLGDYSRGRKGPLNKKIVEVAHSNNAVSVSVFSKLRWLSEKGKPEVQRLFGGSERVKHLL